MHSDHHALVRVDGSVFVVWRSVRLLDGEQRNVDATAQRIRSLILRFCNRRGSQAFVPAARMSHRSMIHDSSPPSRRCPFSPAQINPSPPRRLTSSLALRISHLASRTSSHPPRSPIPITQICPILTFLPLSPSLCQPSDIWPAHFRTQRGAPSILPPQNFPRRAFFLRSDIYSSPRRRARTRCRSRSPRSRTSSRTSAQPRPASEQAAQASSAPPPQPARRCA